MSCLGLRLPHLRWTKQFTKATFHQPQRNCRKMIDVMDHCTGLEKRERLAHQAGISDPWDIEKAPIKRGTGTKECPTLIPSAFDARLVGCICHEEQRFACWMWLIKGMPRRCECGFWFKLVKVAPV